MLAPLVPPQQPTAIKPASPAGDMHRTDPQHPVSAAKAETPARHIQQISVVTSAASSGDAPRGHTNKHPHPQHIQYLASTYPLLFLADFGRRPTPAYIPAQQDRIPVLSSLLISPPFSIHHPLTRSPLLEVLRHSSTIITTILILSLFKTHLWTTSFGPLLGPVLHI